MIKTGGIVASVLLHIARRKNSNDHQWQKECYLVFGGWNGIIIEKDKISNCVSFGLSIRYSAHAFRAFDVHIAVTLPTFGQFFFRCHPRKYWRMTNIANNFINYEIIQAEKYAQLPFWRGNGDPQQLYSGIITITQSNPDLGLPTWSEYERNMLIFFLLFLFFLSLSLSFSLSHSSMAVVSCIALLDYYNAEGYAIKCCDKMLDKSSFE